jgi:AcrR family transcriptional regulator
MPEVSLRERRRMRTRRSIQEQAMRLFVENGYATTTISDIASAAEVSAMTVHRYFPTKEDLVLSDDGDPLIAERIRARPDDEPVQQRISAALVEGVAEMPDEGRRLLLARLRLVLATPALRSRLWDNQYATQKVIVETLREDPPDADREFRLWVTAGACLAAASAALVHWVGHDGQGDPGALLARALTVLTE